MADINPDELREFMEAFRTSTGTAGRELGMLGDAAKNAEEAQKKNMAAVKGAADWMRQLGGTVMSAERGTGKYASAVTSVTDAVGDAASKFGILGIVVGQVIKIFGGMVAASLKQNDALIKSYRSLSEFGAIDSSGIKGTLDLIQNLGGNTENADAFLSSLKANAEGLTVFGGSAAEGASKFSKSVQNIVNGAGPLGKQLTNLGYTVEDITKYGSHFVAQQSINGNILKKDALSTSAVMGDYLKNLSELSMLTGKDKDQAQEAYDAQQIEIGWRLKLNEIAKTDPDKAKRMQDVVAGTMLLNKEAGYALIDMQTNGAATTQKTNMNMLYFGDTIAGLDKVINGTGDVAEGVMKSFKSGQGQLESSITQFAPVGKLNADAAGELALNVEKLNTARLVENSNLGKFRENLDKITKSGDNRLNQENDREKTARLLKNAEEQFIFSIGNQAVPAVGGLVSIFNTLGSVLASMVYWITKKMGTLLGTGTIDMRSMFTTFDTMGDVVDALAQKQKEEVDIKEQLNKLAKEESDKKQELIDTDKQLEELGKKKTALTAAEINKLHELQRKHLDLPNQIKEIHAKNEKERESLNQQLSQNKAEQTRAMNAGKALSMTNEQAGAAPGTASGFSPHHIATEGLLAGLNIKEGDVLGEGQTVNPKMLEIARQIQNGIPGFAYFSAFNDQYHQNSDKTTNSKHKQGLAADFALSAVPDDKQWQYIKENIESYAKSMGSAATVLNEYKDPSKGATGGHIHAEISGKTQGMFKGPESGYWLKAHGEEALMNEQGLTNLITKAQLPGNGGSLNDDSISALLDVMVDLNDKFDSLINYSKRQLDVSSNILTYTKA